MSSDRASETTLQQAPESVDGITTAVRAPRIEAGLQVRPVWRVAQPLKRLQAMVLLGGAMRSTSLHAAIGRSVLDLPVEPARSVLDCWRAHCTNLAQSLEQPTLPVRLILDASALQPRCDWGANGPLSLSVERDPVAYRGSGGLLRDLCEEYDDDAFVLVASAAQILCAPLETLAAALAGTDSDAAIIAHDDGTPSGLMLLRRKCLREISPVGFVDMKEQGLPLIARRHDIAVVSRPQPSGLPVRTLGDYIEALSRQHRESTPRTLEEIEPVFSLIENPADVHPTARVHNSIVLRGGVVQEKAVVVASVVCPGGQVARGQLLVDDVATAMSRGRKKL